MSRFLEKEVKRGIGKDKTNGDKKALGEILVAASKAWRSLYGEVDLPKSKQKPRRPKSNQEITKTSPHIDFEMIVARAVDRYVSLGFHTELGLPEQVYRDTFPRLKSQPETFKGRFDIPVIVETKISPQRQAELAGLNYFLADLEIKDWEKDPKGYKTPGKPYVAWMNDGKLNLGKSVENVRRSLADDERGATICDGVALYIAHPEILKDHSIDLPGTQVGSVDAPCLGLWFGRPRLYDSGVGGANPGFGSASCGRV